MERMLHRLALACGTWDVDALARAIPAAVLQRWLAYFEREPWGGAEDWRRTGEQCAAVYNARPYRGKDSKDVRPDQFGPRPWTPPPTPEQKAAAVARGRAAWAGVARQGGIGVVTAQGAPARASDLLN